MMLDIRGKAIIGAIIAVIFDTEGVQALSTSALAA